MGQDREKELAVTIQEVMIQKEKTLACAESCSGGYLSYMIAQNSGASAFFLGSLVTYADDMKEKILHVPRDILQEHGAVSKLVVSAMLEGIFFTTAADFGIAISGIAGPLGGSLEKPVGTVWIAVGERKKQETIICLSLQGDRKQIMQEAAYEALHALYKIL